MIIVLAVLLGGYRRSYASEPGSKIILIGGTWSYNPGSHEWPHGIEMFERMLAGSPEFQTHSSLSVEAFPHEWPTRDQLEEAATIVIYFSGDKLHPLLDPERRRVFAEAMDRGVGLVALHQAFTLPLDDTSIAMKDWLGGARYGKANRTTKPAALVVRSKSHPVSTGLEDFIQHDEFYPTIQFNEAAGTLSPIWSADLPIHFTEGKATANAEIESYDVAWAYERENGGRSFAYTGGHFLAVWDNVQARTALLNAILWTAGKDVPSGGVTTNVPEKAAFLLAFPNGQENMRLDKSIVTTSDQNEVLKQTWGTIEWFVSGKLKNSTTMTVGVATISAGQSNPVHFHPNCDEILHVMSGTIRHYMDGVEVVMRPGDTVSIPQSVHHNAVNIGDDDARLAISFNTAWREVVGE